jgi:hypothetical protein
MKKMLLVVTIMALVASFSVTASAATTLFHFTLRDTSGNAYCDGMFFYSYGTPKTLVDGYHYNDNCAGGQSNVNGFKAGVSSSYQYGAGAAFIVSDPLFGNGSGGGTGLVWLVNPVYKTWTLWESGGGSGEFIGNHGTFVNGTVAGQKGTKAATQR